MTLDQMNEYSSTGSNMVAVQDQSVTVTAGNQGGSLNQVFSGTLISSFIDLSNVPEVSFVCAAVAGYYNKAAPSAPNTYEGLKRQKTLSSLLLGKLDTHSRIKTVLHIFCKINICQDQLLNKYKQLLVTLLFL